ncbi:MAG TPA: NlpC/P60 family protein [Acidimicrobiales bacterium]|nr:NlpC/P60 family protein [Acidimicrobiales bacterium]
MTKVLLAAMGFVLALAVGLVGLTAVGGASATAESSSSTLNTSAIPLPGVIPWLEQAGSLCPTITAPFLAAQISVESDWDPTAVSSAGAEGLAQFMPTTWPSWGQDDDGTGNVSPFNPADAVMAQGRYNCASAAALAPLEGPGVDTLALVLAAYDYSPRYVLDAGGVPDDPALAAYIQKVEAAIPTYSAALAVGGTTGFASAEIVAAESQLGVPYSWAGGSYAGPTLGTDQGAGTVGFDCSGLVLFAVYQASGGTIKLPHSSEIQVTLGQAVDRSEIEPGDVIGFALDPSNPGDFDHIGIYVGQDEMIDAPDTGSVVRIDSLASSYWQSVPWSVRRFG